MRRILLAIAAALLGVQTAGEAWAWEKDATGKWEYELMGSSVTCRICPADKDAVSGALEIPAQLTPMGGGKAITVTEIGQSAFEGCRGLTSVSIPNSVTEIGQMAFSHCTGLTSVTLPNSVKVIGVWAFNGCRGLTSVSIPNSVTEIAYGAFTDCTGLTVVTIPESVTVIGDGAFLVCTGLTSVTIPNSVKEIGKGAFSGCTRLTKIEVDADNKSYVTVDGVLFSKDKAKLTCYPAGRKGEYTIPSIVTKIGDYAFSRCPDLTVVTVPEVVGEIGEGAFSDCKRLAVVRWQGGGYVRMWEHAFDKSMNERILRVFRGAASYYTSLWWVKSYGFVVLDKDAASVVIFHANGGEFEKDKHSIVMHTDATGKIKESEVPTPSREGCAFQGWYQAGAKEAFDISQAIAQDLVLEARWDKYAVIFTVYNAKGESVAGAKVKVGSEEKATGASGASEFLLAVGEHSFIVSLAGHADFTGTVKVSDRDVKQEIDLKPSNSNPSNSETLSTAVESVLLAGTRVVANPVGDALELEGTGSASRVEVYSLAGVPMHAQALHGERRVAVSSSGWASGVYVVRLVARDGERTLRLVKR